MFQGERVRLRAVSTSDLDDTMAWINDESVTRYLSQVGQVTSRGQEEAFLARESLGRDDRRRTFTLETLQGQYLGHASLDDIDYVNRHAELGLVIGRTELHGQGYGSDAVKLLLRIAFQTMNLEKVYLRVIGGNLGAIRVYQKCGFREAVRFHRHCFIHGEWQDDILMEAFRDEVRTVTGLKGGVN